MILLKFCILSSLLCIAFTKLIIVSDKSGFKKELKSHSNILVVVCENAQSCGRHESLIVDLEKKTSKIAKVIQVNCDESKKLCKYIKTVPKPFKILHFNEGKFNKEYDRKLRLQSLIRFLEDPTGDVPWEEDDQAKDIVHIKSSQELQALANRHKDRLPALIIIFYTPWCGYCKKIKPAYAQIATELKSSRYLFVGVNGDISTNEELKAAFNVTGYPSIYFIRDGNRVYKYGGGISKDELKKFVLDPNTPTNQPEKSWQDETNEIDFLTDGTFNDYVNKHSSVLVMFYAPWCGHCKTMKPEVVKAVKHMKTQNIAGKIAAVDSTEQKKISKEYNIEGFPTLKYFKNGVFQFDISERTEEGLVKFMINPKKPPPPEKVIPWKEEPNSSVLHPNPEEYKAVLKRHKHLLVMFYAPWCGHCKATKPEYQRAAQMIANNDEIIKTGLAAVDCTESEEHGALCVAERVEGYPTLKYYSYGKTIPGISFNLDRNAEDFVAFLMNPSNPKRDPRRHWLHLPDNDAISILESDNFVQNLVAKGGASLVMFYAPWCGHCNAMKPGFIAAAKTLQKTQPKTLLAAVDTTQEISLGQQYKVEGYPTLIYFPPNGEWFKYNGGRSKEDIVNFMVTKEQERLEEEKQKQRRIQEEQERLQKEKEEQERLQREREEQERLQKEREEQERLQKEREEQERLQKEREEQERLQKEREEQERLQKEREEQERLQREREEERLQKEKDNEEKLKKVEKEKKLDEAIDKSLDSAKEQDLEAEKEKQEALKQENKQREEKGIILEEISDISDIQDILVNENDALFYFYNTARQKRQNIENTLKVVKEESNQINGFSVNCENNKVLCDSMNLDNLPALLVYRNGGLLGQYTDRNWSHDKLYEFIIHNLEREADKNSGVKKEEL